MSANQEVALLLKEANGENVIFQWVTRQKNGPFSSFLKMKNGGNLRRFHVFTVFSRFQFSLKMGFHPVLKTIENGENGQFSKEKPRIFKRLT